MNWSPRWPIYCSGRKGDKMPLPSYAYSAARIFALENKLLGRDRIERMVESPTPEDVLKVLSETDYAAAVSELSGAKDYEELLSGEIRRVHDLFREISPNPRITDLFFLKYDFHNLKVLQKAKFLGKKQDNLLVEDGGTMSPSLLKEAVEEEDYSELPDYMSRALKEVHGAMAHRVDPQKIAIILDRAMYERIFEVCRRENDDFTLGYFRLLVDLTNIKSFFRVKKIERSFEFLKGLLLPGGDLDDNFFLEAMGEPIETIISSLNSKEYNRVIVQGAEEYTRSGSLSTFERLMDDFLLSYVKAARWNPLGIEPIIGYLLAKENEIRIIRIIMVGKINNLSADTIRERLRDVYV